MSLKMVIGVADENIKKGSICELIHTRLGSIVRAATVPCEHQDVQHCKVSSSEYDWFMCNECGKKVKPVKFEEAT